VDPDSRSVRDGVHQDQAVDGEASMVTKEAFIATLYELLDERSWGTIDWETDDDFEQLLEEAWARAELHTPLPNISL
jgi:hypothetical protein